MLLLIIKLMKKIMEIIWWSKLMIMESKNNEFINYYWKIKYFINCSKNSGSIIFDSYCWFTIFEANLLSFRFSKIFLNCVSFLRSYLFPIFFFLWFLLKICILIFFIFSSSVIWININLFSISFFYKILSTLILEII